LGQSYALFKSYSTWNFFGVEYEIISLLMYSSPSDCSVLSTTGTGCP
jgi:hypothetical protein